MRKVTLFPVRNSTAHAAESRKGGDDHDDGQAYPHAGESQLAHRLRGLHVADVDPVHQVIEHVDDLGGDGGQGQREQELSDAAAAKVHRFLLGIFHGVSSFGMPWSKTFFKSARNWTCSAGARAASSC